MLFKLEYFSLHGLFYHRLNLPRHMKRDEFSNQMQKLDHENDDPGGEKLMSSYSTEIVNTDYSFQYLNFLAIYENESK